MDIKKLFSGIAVIIDNEIMKEDSIIYKIKMNLLKYDIPVVCFEEVPSKSVVESLGNASFIILDWNYLDEEGVNVGMLPGVSTLQEESKHEIIEFIRSIMSKLFVPIFVFSGVDIDEVKGSLIEEELYDDQKPSRIFVKSKADIESEEELFKNIEDWVKQMPSVYAMKILENNLRDTQNKMFIEWYNYSPQWITIIWNMLKTDSSEVQQEFGEFFMRNLVNRINPFNFEEQFFDLDGQVNYDELAKVMEYERYIKYDDVLPEQAYTGDLFKRDNKYYLNVRAQCDLSRKSDKVELYLIEGKELESREIITEDIRVTSEGELKFSDKAYKLEEINTIIKQVNEDEEEATRILGEINEKFMRYRNQIFFGQGEILEKKPEAIIACIDNGKIIKFRLDIKIMKFKNIKKDRIGRILPPYITRVQQKCSQYIIREGTMPLPKELFECY